MGGNEENRTRNNLSRPRLGHHLLLRQPTTIIDFFSLGRHTAPLLPYFSAMYLSDGVNRLSFDITGKTLPRVRSHYNTRRKRKILTAVLAMPRPSCAPSLSCITNTPRPDALFSIVFFDRKANENDTESVAVGQPRFSVNCIQNLSSHISFLLLQLSFSTDQILLRMKIFHPFSKISPLNMRNLWKTSMSEPIDPKGFLIFFFQTFVFV